MKPVKQEEKTGCGIACFATLAGIDYLTAKNLANKRGIFAEDPKLWSDTDSIRKLCASLNIKISKAHKQFQSWDMLPDLALLAIKWHKEKGIAFWHWSVFVREQKKSYVLDPNMNLKANRRTDFGRIKPKWFMEVFSAADHTR